MEMRKLLSSEKKQQLADAQGVGALSTDPLLGGPGSGSNPPKESKKEKKKKFAKVLAEAKNLNVNMSGSNKTEKLTVAMEREEVSVVTTSSRSERASAEKESVLQASDIDSLEQIEALIKSKTVPAETVTIHSPESGTTIY